MQYYRPPLPQTHHHALAPRPTPVLSSSPSFLPSFHPGMLDPGLPRNTAASFSRGGKWGEDACLWGRVSRELYLPRFFWTRHRGSVCERKQSALYACVLWTCVCVCVSCLPLIDHRPSTEAPLSAGLACFPLTPLKCFTVFFSFFFSFPCLLAFIWIINRASDIFPNTDLTPGPVKSEGQERVCSFQLC